MALKSDRSVSSPFPTLANPTSTLTWDKVRDLSSCSPPIFAPSTWVKLFSPPTAFAYDEAWLLCQCDDDQWLAWIPDYGEILLNIRDFCSINEA